jgi:hypothetical protein
VRALQRSGAFAEHADKDNAKIRPLIAIARIIAEIRLVECLC